jgi:putative membrane protein
MVVYDIVLEPFAIKFDMWSWEAVAPPIQNYLAWFVIAFLLFFLVWRSRLKFTNPMALPMYIIHVAFFSILFITN